MTLPFWCLLVGVLLPIVVAFRTTKYKSEEFGELDQLEPRAQSAKLTGAGGRAVAAQANAWEALALFTPAVLVAHLAGANAFWSGVFSVIWVVARCLHPYFYIGNNGQGRGLTFITAFLCCLVLFGLAAFA